MEDGRPVEVEDGRSVKVEGGRPVEVGARLKVGKVLGRDDSSACGEKPHL